MDPGFPEAANRYSRFREWIVSMAGPRAATTLRTGEPDPTSESEIEIQARWFGGEFGRIFSGEDGEKIEIVQFGHWNRGAGPDFTETAVRINGVLHSGAIELDLDARDWEGHGHGSNPSFEPVILHVYTNGPSQKRFFTRTEQHRAVCQLQLPQYAWSQGPPDFLPEAFPGRCLAPLSQMTDHEVSSLLQFSSQYRLQEKSNRFGVLSAAASSEQAFYQGVAEALGFRSNKIAMAVLAQRCPIRKMQLLGPREREAVLFGSAGFLTPELFEQEASREARHYMGGLWDCWWALRADFEVSSHRKIPWSFSGNRPVNHPHRRLGALLALIHEWKNLGSLWQCSEKSLGKIVNNSLNNLRHPFWERHYTLRSDPSDRPLSLIGKDRRLDILGNVVFPGAIGLQEQRWNEFMSMPKVDSNQKLRRATARLFGPDRKRQKLFTSYYYQQQGLLQIYRDFCLEDLSECDSCSFPEQLTQWRQYHCPENPSSALAEPVLLR